MGKTIILNLSGVKLSGDVLDVGESYGVIYNISKDAIDEVSIDLLEGDIDEKKITQKKQEKSWKKENLTNWNTELPSGIPTIVMCFYAAVAV